MSQGKPSLNSCGSSTQVRTQCSKNYRNGCRVQRLLLRSLASMLHVEMRQTLVANSAGKFDFALKDGAAHETKRNKPIATGSCPSQKQKSLCHESLCFCKAGSCNLALRKMAVRNLARYYLASASYFTCSAQVLPELRECAPRTTFVLKSCDCPAGAAGMCSAYYVCT